MKEEDGRVIVEADEDIFEAIKEIAPPLEHYINTNDPRWEQIGQGDWQGPHPIHGSETGWNFRIYSDKQRWRCYREGHKVDGSIIDFVAMEEGIINCAEAGNIPNQKWPDVIRACCNQFNIEYEGLDSNQEVGEEIKKKRREKRKIKRILTHFSELAHDKLDHVEWDGKTAREHLKKNRAFSDDIIDQLNIGFWNDELTEELKNEYSVEELIKTGLFIMPGGIKEEIDSLDEVDESDIFSSFENRIIFPYWKNNKVVYLIARKTPLTDWENSPKYVKQRSGEKYEYVSDAIKNDVFYGEDQAYGDQILITEGVTDCISLIDAGYNAISPVTTQFRENDKPKLDKLTQNASEIIVMNDNEESGAGEEGAVKTAEFLFHKGRNVKIAFPPREPDEKKVDVDDYLTKHDNDPEAVEELIEDATPYIDYRISLLKEEDYEGIKEVLADLKGKDDMLIEHSLNKLKKHVGMPKTVLRNKFKEMGGRNPVKESKRKTSSSKKDNPAKPKYVAKSPKSDEKSNEKDVSTGGTQQKQKTTEDEGEDENVPEPVVVKQEEQGPGGEGLIGKIISETEQIYEIPPENFKDETQFQIHIRGVKLELSQRQMMRPNKFAEFYFGRFKEYLQISQEDWALILQHWAQNTDIKRAPRVSDADAARDDVLSKITKGHEVDQIGRTLDSDTSYYIEDGVLFYPSQHVKDVVQEYNSVSMTQLSYHLEDLTVGPTKPRRLQDNLQRFWRFDLEKIEKLGREDENKPL